jgi:hypothetical protein
MAVCTLVITHVTSAIGMMMDTRAALLFIAMCVIVMQYNQIQCLKAKTGFHDASVHEYNNDADTIKQETNDICNDQPVTPLCCSEEEFGTRFHDGVMKLVLVDLVQTVKRRELAIKQETNDICYVQQETNDICDDQPVTPLCCSAEEFGVRFRNGVMKVILDDIAQTVERRELSSPFRDIYTMGPEY